MEALRISYDSKGNKVTNENADLPLCFCLFGQTCVHCVKPTVKSDYRRYGQGTMLKNVLKRISK